MKPLTTVYTGERLEDPDRPGERDTVSPIVVQVDGFDLSPRLSQRIHNHSPDGFNWGYGGSGPAQLALAILYDFTGDGLVSHLYHQDFKREFVAGWPSSWRITGVAIADFLAQMNEANPERRP